MREKAVAESDSEGEPGERPVIKSGEAGPMTESGGEVIAGERPVAESGGVPVQNRSPQNRLRSFTCEQRYKFVAGEEEEKIRDGD